MEAIERLQPADLYFGETKHAFGLGDGRDPVIFDRTVHILRAFPAGNTTASPIASIVQWGMHPEVTLGYQPLVPDADCILLGREPGCSARGQFMTADYPGNFRRVLQGAPRPARSGGGSACLVTREGCCGRGMPRHRAGRQRRGDLLQRRHRVADRQPRPRLGGL